MLVSQSSAPGDLVIDPFMGSGSAGVAAVKLGRSFAGNDLEPKAVELTRVRLIEAGAVEGVGLAAARVIQQGLSGI